MAEVTWDWREAGYEHGFAKGLIHERPSFFDFAHAWNAYQPYDGYIKDKSSRDFTEAEWAAGYLKGYANGLAAQPSSIFETFDWPDGHGFSYGLISKYRVELYLNVFKLIELVPEPINFSIHTAPITMPNYKTREVWYFRLKNRRCSGPYPTEAGAIDMAHSYLASLGFEITSRNENTKVSSVRFSS